MFDLEESTYAEDNEVRDLDHNVLSGVNGITDLSDPFYAVYRRSAESSVSGYLLNLVMILPFLVKDYQAPRASSKPLFHVPIDVCDHVVKRQHVGPFRIERKAEPTSVVREGLLVYSDEVHTMLSRINEVDNIICKSGSVLHGVPCERPATARRQKLVCMEFKVSGDCASEVAGDDLAEFLSCLVPTLISQADATENHDGLVWVYEVTACIARFVQVEEMYVSSP